MSSNFVMSPRVQDLVSRPRSFCKHTNRSPSSACRKNGVKRQTPATAVISQRFEWQSIDALPLPLFGPKFPARHTWYDAEHRKVDLIPVSSQLFWERPRSGVWRRVRPPGHLRHLPSRLRPYSVENSRSHSNSEDKPPKARSVLGWGTAREALGCCRLFVIIRGGAPPDNQDRKPVSRLPTHRFAVRGAAQIQVLPRAAFQRHGGTGGPPNHRYANQRPQTPPPWPARRHFP